MLLMPSTLTARDFVLFALFVAWCGTTFAAQPASETVVLPSGLEPTTVIDLLTELHWQRTGATASPGCHDAAFVRRVYLDLIGRIPTLTDAQQFLDSRESDKRQRLINSLIDSPEYGRRMSELFDAVLMGRKGAGKQQERIDSGWNQYLADSFNENRPWDELVRDILLARPAGQSDRGAVWFLYERKNNHQDIAEAIAPGFFGVQIQCAQCHDHPLADEIEQGHYWGLVAFFNRGKNVSTPQGARVSESAIGGFAKFTDLTGMASGAQLTFLGKSLTVPEQPPQDGQKEENSPDKYHEKDANGNELTPRVPKFSRREEFVQQFVQDNPLVARALVNRVWAMLLGRGIVHPVDKMDSMHDPSHPELLDWLAVDFAQNGYDVKRLVRSIANSQVYQLDAQPLGDASDASTFAWALQRPLTAESLYRSILVAVDGCLDNENTDMLNSFREVFPDVFPDESMSVLTQSLFLSNSDFVQRLTSVRESSVLAELVAQDENQQVVHIAFETAFGRQPDDEELIRCLSFLSDRQANRPTAIGQLMWALVTSAEFRFNH